MHYRSYMANVQDKKMICLFTRNALVLNLHAQYGVDPIELKKMFHKKKRQIKSIIKGLTLPNSRHRAIQKERFKANAMKVEITKIIQGCIDNKTQLVTSTSVCKKISNSLNIDVPPHKVVQIMKDDLGLKWKRVRNQQQYINTQKIIALMARFAWALLRILEEGKIIINFDDSQVYGGTGKSMSWDDPKHTTGRNYRRDISGLSFHLAITSTFGAYFQFLQGNNNDTSVAAFYIGLAQALSTTSPEWRKTHVLLLDNCASHKTKQNLSVLRNVGFTVRFFAPASFKAIPVTSAFGAIKCKYLDDLEIPGPESGIVDLPKAPTVRQALMAKITNYLLELKPQTVASFFRQRFAHLAEFAGHVKV